jgi:hypothetical protein
MTKKLSTETINQCNEELKFSLFLNSNLESFYGEWLEEKIITKNTKLNYDDQFKLWFNKRIRTLYFINRPILEKLIDIHGKEDSYLFYEKKWSQEVALAQKMRLSDNIKISVLAHIFLSDIQNNLKNMLSSIIEIYKSEGQKDKLYMNSNIHHMNYHEILTSKNWDTFKPLWLRYSLKEYKKDINKLSSKEISDLHLVSRQLAFDEIKYRKIDRYLNILEENKILFLSSILSFANKNNLSADQLYWIKNKFYYDLKSGNILIFKENKSYWHSFLNYIKINKNIIPDIIITKKEQMKRIKNIEHLTNNWIESAKKNIILLEDSRQEIFNSWMFEVIHRKTRIPSNDFMLDYILYFLKYKNQIKK